jgi:hypothetical protein
VRSTEIMKAGSLVCLLHSAVDSTSGCLPFRSSFTLPLAFDAYKFNEKEDTSNTEARKPDTCLGDVVEQK